MENRFSMAKYKEDLITDRACVKKHLAGLPKRKRPFEQIIAFQAQTSPAGPGTDLVDSPIAGTVDFME